jgi:7 transmembrane receptor (rhodopsin family)
MSRLGYEWHPGNVTGYNSTMDDDSAATSVSSLNDFDMHSFMRDSLSPRDMLSDDLPGPLRMALIASYVAIIVLAVTGNSAVIIVVLSNAKLRTVTNIFLVSLAVSDLLIAAVNMPLQLRLYVQKEWLDGEVLCSFSHYIQGVFIVASIFTLTGIALDR